MIKLLDRTARDAAQALVFADSLKLGGPWVFSARCCKGLPPVATFDDCNEHEARAWIKRQVRGHRAPVMLLPDTRHPQDRPVLASDLVGSSLIGVELKGEPGEVAKLLEEAPEPATALVNDGLSFTAIWKLAKAEDMQTANGVSRLLADVVGGEPALVVALPGFLHPGAKRPAALIHLRKPRVYTPEQLGWHRGKPLESVLVRIRNRRKASVSTGTGAFRSAARIQAQPTQWLWPGVFPVGAMSLLSGQPKMGKSQIAVSMAAIVSAGLSWPTGEACEPGNVILMECEDSAADTQARLLAAGADLNRIMLRGREDGPLDLTGPDMGLLAEEAKRMGGVRLVVLSPGLQFFGVKGGDADAAVRERLRMVLLWAAQNQAAVLFITHPPKNAKPTLDAQFAGADAYRRAARAAWAVLPDAGDDEPEIKRKRRVMACAGSNVGADDLRLLYRIEGHILPDGVETSRIRWLPPDPEPEQCAKQPGAKKPAPEAVVEPVCTVHTGPEEPVHTEHTATVTPLGKRLTPKAWLSAYLSDGDEHDAKALKEAAKREGIHEPALYKAAKALAVVIRPGAFQDARLWSLPGERQA